MPAPLGFGAGAEAFSAELCAHQYRVAQKAVALYRRWVGETGGPLARVWLYEWALTLAALVHDVGKRWIGHALFMTDRRLTSREYRLVQQHPSLGARMLGEPCSPVDKVVVEGVLHHHQRWDGGGYPVGGRGKQRGLKGGEIPLVARIIAIADVYDALRMKRSYKGSWKEERILEEIRQQSGRQFDPYLVRLFLDREG